MKKTFNTDKQNKLAEQFHALHHTGQMLVLPNTWDCTSAKIYEDAGFPAIATTSSGISWTCGYQDGEHIPPDLMLNFIRRIVNVVDIPVTADIEAAYYRDDFKQFSKFIADVIEAGAVGINLEDADPESGKLRETTYQVEMIKTVRKVCKEKGVNLYLNARTDGMAAAKGDLRDETQICIERSKAYEEAGADGIFVPFVRDIETVAQLKIAINLPLNILMADSLDVEELKKLRVNRVSIGGKPKLAAMKVIKKIAEELRNSNNWPSLFDCDHNYGEVNAWFD